MKNCTRCGSFAINENSHGRKTGEDLHLCDVCYWRERAEVMSIVKAQVENKKRVWEVRKKSKVAIGIIYGLKSALETIENLSDPDSNFEPTEPDKYNSELNFLEELKRVCESFLGWDIKQK